MENKKERIRRILGEKEWSVEDRNFIVKVIDEDRDLVRDISRQYFEADIEKPEDLLTKSESDRILKSINEETGQIEKRERFFGIQRLAIAASFLLIVTLGFFTRENWKAFLFEENRVTISTQFGEVRHVNLSDGSAIWLNGGSTLVYPEKFRGETRSVSLEGEAFFDVKSDASTPFVIESEAFNTTVVGTEFNIRCYREDSISAVAVASGIVKVALKGNSTNQYDVSPEEEVIYNKNKGTLSMSMGYSQSQINWKEREFNYSGMPLGMVLKDLQRSFNVDILADDKVKGCKIFADFRGDKLNDILEVLKSLVNAKIRQEGNGTYSMVGLDEGC